MKVSVREAKMALNEIVIQDTNLALENGKLVVQYSPPTGWIVLVILLCLFGVICICLMRRAP